MQLLKNYRIFLNFDKNNYWKNAENYDLVVLPLITTNTYKFKVIFTTKDINNIKKTLFSPYSLRIFEYFWITFW